MMEIIGVREVVRKPITSVNLDPRGDHAHSEAHRERALLSQLCLEVSTNTINEEGTTGTSARDF
jgi:hypothetical protein